MNFRDKNQKIDNASVRGNKLEKYKLGNPKFNLMLNERRLLLTAVLKTNWNMEKAMELNFPNGGIDLNGYNRKLLDHHIFVGKKTYTRVFN